METFAPRSPRLRRVEDEGEAVGLVPLERVASGSAVSPSPSPADRKRDRPSLCLHCGTPVPAGCDSEFCCRGCEHVHGLLKERGLDRYYALRGERALAPVPEQTNQRDRLWLEALREQVAAQGDVRRFTVDVQGVQCGACVWLIEALFKRQPEAYQAHLNPALGQLACVVGSQFPLEAFVDAVEEFGYRVGPATKQASRESSGLLLRTGICVALAGNTMFLSATTYLGLREGPLYELVQNGIFAMATLSALIGGSYFVDRAYQGLKRGVLHLDLPIALGMGLAYAGSAISHYFGGARASYLDTVSVFIGLMLVGRLLQERLVERNRRQLLATEGASSLLARKVVDGRTELTSCAGLRPDDELLVCPGELVPVQARLLSESAECALDWINGESEPRRFARGDVLAAGAINAGQQALHLRALSGFERSELDALLRVDAAPRQRTSGDFWDVLARVYVALVLAATAVGALAWALGGGTLQEVLDVSTAVLVVTCPCAFGIATPLAYELAVSALRKRGLYVRDGGFFDRAARVRRVVFDKTGTLTTGSLRLVDPRVLETLSPAQRQVLYELASKSGHPKSAAIARAVSAFDPDVRFSGLAVREVAGHGVEATVGERLYRLGDPGWALDGAKLAQGPVFSESGALLAVLLTEEVPRLDAGPELEALEREGYELWIASGDRKERVDALAETLHIAPERALSDLTPEDKRALIERLDRGDTLMIGDGVNDGPALSRALCAGTPAVDRPFVPARTDFYFLTPGLQPIRAALHMGKRVRRVVRRALGFATAYNVAAVALCYAGLMRPWLAAVLMPASSILVLTYTALSFTPRSNRWKS